MGNIWSKANEQQVQVSGQPGIFGPPFTVSVKLFDANFPLLGPANSTLSSAPNDQDDVLPKLQYPQPFFTL
jgi:hypothetical protein